MDIVCYLWVWSEEGIQKYSRIYGKGFRDNLIWLSAFREGSKHQSGPQYEQWQSCDSSIPLPAFHIQVSDRISWCSEDKGGGEKEGQCYGQHVCLHLLFSESIKVWPTSCLLGPDLSQTLTLCLPKTQFSHWNGLWVDTLGFICSK